MMHRVDGAGRGSAGFVSIVFRHSLTLYNG